jgi:HEAT repeat protein
MPAERSGKILLLWSSIVLAVIATAAVCWIWLPVWFPQFVQAHSPWIEPCLRAEVALDPPGGDMFPATEGLKTELHRFTDPVPGLAAAVHHRDPRVRRRAIGFLTEHVDRPEALAALARAVEDPDPRVRTDAVLAFKVDDVRRLLPVVEPACADRNADVRSAGMQALEQECCHGNSRAAELALAAMSDPEASVRLNAVFTRFCIGGSAARTDLGKALEDSDQEVRDRARWAIDSLDQAAH